MQANLNIILTDEDIEGGLTVAQAVQKLFPTEDLGRTVVGQLSSFSAFTADLSGSADAQPEDYPGDANVDRGFAADADALVGSTTAAAGTTMAEDVAAAEQALGTSLELDTSKVPWSAKIHSSNKKQYSSGPNKGRWQWKKNTDETERETIAMELALQVANAAPATPLAASDSMDGTQAAPAGTVPPISGGAPAGGQAAAGTTPPGSGAPSTGQVVSGNLPVNWPDFLKSLAPAGKTYADVDAYLPQFGMTSVSELSPDDQKLARDQIAASLGLRSQA